MEPKEKIGKLYISTKEAKIFVIDGDFEDLKFRLTSGIGGKHGKGGQSAARFSRKREEEILHFFKRVKKYMNLLEVETWVFEGDKEIIKKFKN